MKANKRRREKRREEDIIILSHFSNANDISLK
jgi:hypothetical protein